MTRPNLPITSNTSPPSTAPPAQPGSTPPSARLRKNLTDEWKERGITAERDFSILTSEIAKATFDITPSEHKELKGLARKNENLRDHMTDLELIFTMLGEKVTTEISQT